MLGVIVSALKIIFLLGFLVFIHEGGHFIVAKLCKIKVNEFALGFGPTIWKRQGKETKYALRLIPLGGFVSMEGEERASDAEGSYSKASTIKKIAILIAGGTVNILFGLILYFVIVSYNGEYISTTVQEVVPGYAAIDAGIQNGDKIIKIDGKTVRTKQDMDKILSTVGEKNISIEIIRNGERQEITLVPSAIQNFDTGIYFSVKDGNTSPIVIAVAPESPAEAKGIKTDDVIQKVNGIDVEDNLYKVRDLIVEADEDLINLTINRSGETIEVSLQPNIVYTYVLGVNLKEAENTFSSKIYYGFWNTVDFSTSIIDNLKEMFSGKISKDQFMGPVGISGIVSNTKGITEYAYIIAIVSLSLGVTNLLPFPPLDGGKVLLILIEVIRRKKMKEETELTIQMAGFVLMIALSIYITYNDILRIF